MRQSVVVVQFNMDVRNKKRLITMLSTLILNLLTTVSTLQGSILPHLLHLQSNQLLSLQNEINDINLLRKRKARSIKK